MSRRLVAVLISSALSIGIAAGAFAMANPSATGQPSMSASGLRPVLPGGVTAEDRRVVHAADLQADTVITGLLGLELGTVVVIRGRVIDSRSPEFDSLLEVISVGSHPLASHLVMPFAIADGSRLAGAELPRGVVLSLRVYETGGMVGVPQEARRDTRMVRPVAWQFRTSLVVLSAS